MEHILQYYPLILKGLLTTIEVFLLTLIFSIPLGLPIALGEESKFKPLAFICKAYVFIFRGTPLVLQLMFFYFFPSIVLNVQIDAVTTAIVTFILNYAAYFAEIYRGGMKSIDNGQYEAAKALGLSGRQTLFGIVIPQTMRVILPPVFNEVITLVKDTALVMVIGAGDLMKATNSVVNTTSRISPLMIAAVISLLMTFVLTLGANSLEKYFGKYDRKGE